MKPGFEKAFVDAQAVIISLCKEKLENANFSADKLHNFFFNKASNVGK